MELLLNIITKILFTAVVYMAFPLLRLLINHGKFPEDTAKRIALWNSIVLGAIFCILTIEYYESATAWSSGPAFLYYWINRSLLTRKDNGDVDDESQNAVPSAAPVSLSSSAISYESQVAAEARRTKRIVIAISIVAVLLIALLIGIIIDYVIGNDNSKLQRVGVRTITFDDEFTAEYVMGLWEYGPAVESALISLMDKYAPDQGGGQLYIIEPGEFVAEVDEWCFDPDRKVGDCAIIENIYGFSFCYISSLNPDPVNHPNLSLSPPPSHTDLGVSQVQYNIASIVCTDIPTYCGHIASLESILSKGTYGESIKKEKAIDYLNEQNLDYGQRLVIFKMLFPYDNEYNNDLIEYLNQREDISYEDTVYILEELGFAVFADGSVKW